MTATAAAGLTVVLTVAAMVWAFSVWRRDASIADIVWGPGFAALAWFYGVRLNVFTWRLQLVATLLTVWGLRLGSHILRRHRGEDPRYQAMRHTRGDSFWWSSLFIVFWLQGVLLWFVALPVLAVALDHEPTPFAVTDALGVALFAAGFVFEAVGDRQLSRFRSDPANRGKVLDTGLWRYTRHPNYFGDAVLWWGIFVIALSVPHGWQTIASPTVMTWLLLRVSGVTLLERGLTASRPGYADYVRRTSAFVPWTVRR